MSKFDELKNLAGTASPGPWTHEVNDGVYSVTYMFNDATCGVENVTIDLFCDEPHDASVPHSSDAQYIAAANPAAILELLAIQAQLVEALKASKAWHNGEKWRDSSDPSEVLAWEKHRDIINDALAAAGAMP